MSKQTYVILDSEVKTLLAGDGVRRASLYRVFADNPQGLADFVGDYDDILPGSTVDVDDLKTVYRLRNDGEWVAYRYYGTDAGGLEAAETAAAESILDSMIPDEEVSV